LGQIYFQKRVIMARAKALLAVAGLACHMPP
jgi:hypothetical protein